MVKVRTDTYVDSSFKADSHAAASARSDRLVVPTAEADCSATLGLSLIHISEPTRPY